MSALSDLRKKSHNNCTRGAVFPSPGRGGKVERRGGMRKKEAAGEGEDGEARGCKGS